MRSGKSFSGNERNCAFLNLRNGRFANISAVSGFDFPEDGRANVLVDWDHDGDLDVLVTNRNAPRLRFLRNDLPGDNEHVSFKLVGNGKDTNRDAVGARVEVVLAEAGGGTDSRSELPHRLIKTLRAGEGFISQPSDWLHFGLGKGAAVREVKVHWPTKVESGRVERFTIDEINRRYQLVQGSGTAKAMEARSDRMVIEPAPLSLPTPSDAGAVRFTTPVPMPRLPFMGYRGERRIVEYSAGRPTLVCFWATWCQPCLVELRELAARREFLDSLSIDVVALCVDGLDDKGFDPANAADTLKHLGFAYPQGLASGNSVGVLQRIHDDHVRRNRPLPVPVSFLVDASGRLITIYKGAVDTEQLASDLKSAGRNLHERHEWAAPIPGQMLSNERMDRLAADRDARIRVHSAFQLFKWNRIDEAERHLREAIAGSPPMAEAHTNLGVVLFKQGKIGEAEQQYRKAISLDGDLVQALNGLAAVHARRGELEEAVALLQRVVELDPSYVTARRNLATLQQKLRGQK